MRSPAEEGTGGQLRKRAAEDRVVGRHRTGVGRVGHEEIPLGAPPGGMPGPTLEDRQLGRNYTASLIA